MSRSALLMGAATAAFVSAISAPAFAQSRFDLLLGGDAYFEGGHVSQDRDNGLRSTDFRNRLRLLVTPKAKADNGIEYGARLRLLAENGDRTTSADRAFLFVNGTFGTVHLGQENGPSDDSGIIAPSDWGTGGVDGSFPSWLGTSAVNAPVTIANIRALISGNTATRAVYWSPTVSGFKLGVSYQPNSDSYNTDVNRLKVATPAGATRTGAYHDVYEAGGTYADTFGGVTINASLFYLGGKAKNATTTGAAFEDLSSTHAGLTIAYGGFKVGGSYAWSGESGYITRSSLAAASSREKQDVLTVGAQYTVDATTVGVAYLNANDAGDMTVPGRTRFELITTGAKYVVAPGFSVGPEYNHFKLRSDIAANRDQGDIVLLRADLVF